MKKFLALVLALVMTMSLVTISAGAEDFTDAADINYEEAVEVISAIGVVGGYADGSFKPEGGLTRQAAAKIICNMILGPTTAAELDADTAPYPDVAVDSDFAGYIAYCQKEGIISGYADGTFKGANPLTGYAFMKMLLGALGYDGETEGYTGANWSINVAKKAIGEGLNAGLKTEFNGSDFVTREEACLYAFNTLKATMVEYDQQTTINVGGAEVVLAGSAQDLAWGTGTLNDGKVAKDGFVQFAEKYFSKLTRVDDMDVFGRPANTWTYNKVEVGTFVDYTTLALTYTTGVAGGDVYKDLGSAAADFDFVCWYDGMVDEEVDSAEDMNIVKGEDDDMYYTGNGVLTEIYVDVDEEEVTVVQVYTYLAKVTADYNKNKESVAVEVYGADGVSKIYLEDVASIVDLEADDMILVNIADGVIVNVMEPEKIADSAITKYSVSGELPTYVTVAGEKYDAAYELELCDELLTAYNKEALEDYTYDLYLDQYGYVIGIEKVSGTAKYLFLVGYDKPSSNLVTSTAKAAAIFMDGTMAEIAVAFKASNENLTTDLVTDGDANYNAWVKYTEDDGVYELYDLPEDVKAVNVKAGEKEVLSVENVRLLDTADNSNKAYGNDDSIYITVKAEADATDIDGAVENTTNDAIVKVLNLYTGAQSAEIELNEKATGSIDMVIYALAGKSDLYIDAAVVLGDEAGSTNTGYAYAVKGAASEEFADGYYFWDFTAIVDGAEKVLTVKDKYGDVIDFIAGFTGVANVGKAGLLTLTYDDDGYVVGAALNNANKDDDSVYSRKDMEDSEDLDPDVFDAYQIRFSSEYTKLTCAGHTLYTNLEGDIGLTIANGAPVVVLQEDEDGKLSIEEYSTIAAALDALEDSDEFYGTIAAELNDRGTAKYLVLASSTALSGADAKDPTVNDDVKVTVNTKGLKTVEIEITGNADDFDIFNAVAVALQAEGYELADYDAELGVFYAYDMNSVNGAKIPFYDLTAA